MISRAALEAVTDPSNLSGLGDSHAGVQEVVDGEVVAELRRLEGLGADEARQLAREAVIHVGGHVEPTRRRGLTPGRLLRHHSEVWWVPRSAVRS